jgi:DNA-directed RNA polymerase subunit K/omega
LSMEKKQTTLNYSSSMAAQPSIVTRDVEKIAGPTGNIYESVVVISKRARQIAINIKEELSGKLAEFATTVDNLEEIFENREQIEISKFYERMPKPTSTAIEEFLEGKLMYRMRSETDEKPEA